MTPNEILNKRFDKAAVGGYRTDDVHSYLLSVSDYLAAVMRDRDDLERKLMILAEKIEEYRADEDSLQAALIGAQKLGDSMVKKANEEADAIVQEAQRKADEILIKAKRDADTLTAGTKLKIDTEAYTLNRMQTETIRFRQTILNMYEKQMELIRMIPFDEKNVAQPMERPVGFGEAELEQAPPLPIDKPELTFESLFDAEAKFSSLDNQPEEESLVFGGDSNREEVASASSAENATGEHATTEKTSRYGPLEYGEGFRLTRDE